MQSLDHFLNRTYHEEKYNCLHFARDVLLELAGYDIGDRLTAVSERPLDRFIGRGAVRAFERLSAPSTPSLAFFRRPGRTSHCGVYLDGKILHIQPSGVVLAPLCVVMLGFKSVRYYV